MSAVRSVRHRGKGGLRIEIQGQVPRHFSGPRRRRRIVAHLVQVRLGEVEAHRLGEVQHLGHQAVQAVRFLVDVHAASRTSSLDGCGAGLGEARMIISGLRISCATTVDSRRVTTAVRAALPGAGTGDRFGEGVERAAQEARVFVGPDTILCTATRWVRSPVAATSRIAEVTADSGPVTVRATR